MSKPITRLAIVAPFYRWWIKDLVNALASSIYIIGVIVPYNPIIEFVRLLPLDFVRDKKIYTKPKLIDTGNKPSNVYPVLISQPYIKPYRVNARLPHKLAERLTYYVEKIKPMIIHGHTIHPIGIASVEVATRLNVPVVLTIHGALEIAKGWLSDEIRHYVKYALKYSDIITTVSYRNKEIIEKIWSIPSKKILVIPNGFDDNIFKYIPKEHARKKLGLPTDKRILINIGNLVPEKGQKYLIEAFANVRKERDDVLLIIIGSGRLEVFLRKQIKKLGLERSVFIVGHRPHNEIPLWMNAADFLVITSITEGNPAVLFEALGVGLPVIATRVGGIPEIIISDEYGLLCNPKDIVCLTENILNAIDKEKEYNREKIAIYARRYSWSNIAKEYIKIYERVLRDR